MGIKRNVVRLDAVQKATGEAKYVEDLIPVGALHGKMVRSTIANGMVESIDTSEALKMPGVELILTCFDVPKNLFATSGHPLSLDPNHTDTKDKLILEQRVRYYGDDIAVVVADTPLNARLAAEKVKVTYEVFEPLLTPAAAIHHPCTIHEFRPGNELSRMDFNISPEGEVNFYTGKFSTEKEIAGREDLVGVQYYVPMVNACHIEPNGCFAYMEGRKLIICSCNQVPFTLRRNVAEAVGIPVGDIRIIRPYIGGGFGNKQDTMYEPIVALCTMKLGGRPVAIILTREETFTSTRVRHAFDMLIKSEVDAAGKMIKRGLRINSNGGAYAAHTHAVTAYAITNNFQNYPTSGVQVGESSTAYTNLPSAAALRGYGIPQLAFAMESEMDDIALAHGWDPVDLRLKNIQTDGFVDPFDKFVVSSCGMQGCIQRGREVSGWDRKRKEYSEFNKTSKNIKKGIGMACFSYKTGVWPIQVENASCRIVMNEDGTAVIQVGATEIGQGSDTVFCQMVSEITTIPENRLTLIPYCDTDVSPYDSGAYASRQTYVSGGAVRKAAELLRGKLLARAAAVYDQAYESLCLESEKIKNIETGQIICTIGQLCTFMNHTNDHVTMTEHLTAEATYTAQSICFSYGVSYIDLDVDVPLGKIKINKVYSVHDSGQILNPALSHGQLHGGIAMGLGYALGEQLLFDPKTGRPLNNNLLDYKTPTAMDMPEIETYFVETFEPSGPFGNKGLAEPPLIPQAPAVRNAILHATGIGVFKLPMNPQSLVHAFIEAGLIQN